LVRQDNNQVITVPIWNLLLKVVPFFYGDETSRKLLYLHGTVACQYRENPYNIPIKIWLQQDHPNVPPLLYVKPTSDMYISPTPRDVLPDGIVIISYLKNCRHVRH
jgi:ESCRT-I complex subunit TSG101